MIIFYTYIILIIYVQITLKSLFCSNSTILRFYALKSVIQIGRNLFLFCFNYYNAFFNCCTFNAFLKIVVMLFFFTLYECLNHTIYTLMYQTFLFVDCRCHSIKIPGVTNCTPCMYIVHSRKSIFIF